MNEAAISEARARVLEVESEIDEQLDDLLRDPFVWPARLRISKTVGRWRAGVGFTQAGSEALTNHTGRSAKQIASFEVSTDKLLVYKTENERLAVGATQTGQGWAYEGDKSTARRALGWRRRRRIRAVERGLGIPENEVLSDVVRATMMYLESRSLLLRNQPRVVVLGATEHIFARVLAAAARELDIATVYLPHAPTPIDASYSDAPFDSVLLRGGGDEEYYRSLGAVPDHIGVVGDRSLMESEVLDTCDGPVVIAATADYPDDALAQKVQDVREALGLGREELLICPHPRGRTRAGLVGHNLGIAVSDLRTRDVLTELRPRLLITEIASGARLEAELLGIPTISLAPPHYLFEFSLPVAGTTLSELKDEAEHGGPARAASRSDAAKEWVAAVGAEADLRARSAVDEVTVRAEPTLDRWNFFSS